MLHPSTIRLVQRIYNALFSYWFLTVKFLYLSWKMDEEPAFGDALDFKLATDLSPSD